VSISRFAGEGVHVSVSAKNGRITIKALNRGSRRARVQVYVGPGVEVPTNGADR
jgi:L-fucose isomerase-like protein